MYQLQIKNIYSIILYFFFDRSLPYILHSETLSLFYAPISKLLAVLVFCEFFISIKSRRDFRVLGFVVLFYVSLLISTIIGNGDIRRWAVMFYPTAAMAMLLILRMRDVFGAKLFVKGISSLYLMLSIINTFLLIVRPQMFENNCFLGLENQVGYPLMTGLMFTLIDYRLRGTSIKLYIYLFCQIVSIFLIFSASNLCGLILMLLCIIPNPVAFIVHKISLNKIIISIGAFFSIIILSGLLTDILALPWIEYIIVDLLGKNLTLTNRTVIWAEVISGIFDSPLWGHGIRETVNLFYFSGLYSEGMFSAHNQILQTLYEGGGMAFISLLPFIVYINKGLSKCDPFIANVIKMMICVISLMYMGEAPGMDKLLVVLIVGTCISQPLHQHLD